MKIAPIIAVAIVALIAAYAASLGFGSLSFEDNLAERVASHLLALAFFALLIERAVEVIVNNKFMARELSENAAVVRLQRKCSILQSALDLEVQQPVPVMTDQNALTTANEAKNENIHSLRTQIREAKLAKIAADQNAMPDREKTSTEKAAFAATTATILGGLVALTGTTVLAEFVKVPQEASGAHFLGIFNQLQCFVAVDILFTALILAGGSEGIHQIVKGFLSAKDEFSLQT
ncbi:hypothetical protein [uncultured Roseobacter sp.]|uniref:hypothetical protein n=1 Tax=uncultured Roseobacter sp. TaxID=114847 RepID=UPI002616DEDD|nr:hypothetical protein [uncultured Roseobacter sp.]